jgi:hypothetical protein
MWGLVREEEEVVEVKIVSCSEAHYTELIENIRNRMQRIADDQSSEGSGEADRQQVRMAEGIGV